MTRPMLVKCICVFLMAILMTHSQQYAVAYILSNNIPETLPNNSIRVYQKFRFDATVLMNDHTRKTYSNIDALKTLPELSAQTLMKPEHQGTISFKKSTLPNPFWIQEKQIVIIEVDISKFPSTKNELQKYQHLFKHKGNSFFMLNTNDPNETIPLQIGQIFGFDPSKDPLCHINLQANTIQENQALIKECYAKSSKKTAAGSINVSFMYMISQYGVMAIIHIVLTSLITCGSPYMMIWWHKRKDQQRSYV